MIRVFSLWYGFFFIFAFFCVVKKNFWKIYNFFSCFFVFCWKLQKPNSYLLFFFCRGTGHGKNLVIFIFGFDNKNNKKTTKATKITRVKRVLSKQHLRNACCPEQQNAINKLSSHQMFQVRNKSWNLVIF